MSQRYLMLLNHHHLIDFLNPAGRYSQLHEKLLPRSSKLSASVFPFSIPSKPHFVHFSQRAVHALLIFWNARRVTRLCEGLQIGVRRISMWSYWLANDKFAFSMCPLQLSVNKFQEWPFGSAFISNVSKSIPAWLYCQPIRCGLFY